MSVREALMLREAEALSARVPEAARAEIALALAFSRQRVQAVDALWSNGCVAEALRLAREALGAALEAHAALPDGMTAPRIGDGAVAKTRDLYAAAIPARD